MSFGRVRSPGPDQPEPAKTEEVRSNSLTAAERESLHDGAAHSGDAAGATAASALETAPRAKRRWRVFAVAAAVVLVVAAAVAAVVWLPVFTVSTVAVEGNRQVDAEQIVEAAGVGEGENLVGVDTAAAARGVVALPRIREATVTRSLPDTLTVEVVERRVVAWMDDAGQQVLIDDKGEPFTDGAPPEVAVRLEDMDPEDTDLLRGAVDVAAALSDEVGAAVDHLSADSESTYTLHLSDGRTIFWGVAGDNRNKALAVETVLGREGGQWDVSNPQLVTQQ